MKLVEPLGKFVRVDQATANRDRLQYVHVLIEVNVNHDFLEQLTFIIEKGIEVVADIHNEWKPKLCAMCKVIGHYSENYRKQVRKEGVVKCGYLNNYRCCHNLRLMKHNINQ